MKVTSGDGNTPATATPTDQYRWGKNIAGQLRQRLGVWPD